MRVRSHLLAIADNVVVGVAEMLKAWIREVFRLCQQLVLAFSAMLIQIVNNDIYYAARRNRIHANAWRPHHNVAQ